MGIQNSPRRPAKLTGVASELLCVRYCHERTEAYGAVL